MTSKFENKFIPKLASVFRVAKQNQVNQSLNFWALIIFIESDLFINENTD